MLPGVVCTETEGETVLLSMAPMEGLTVRTFRRVHAECFGRLDRYYTPFLAPAHVGQAFTKKALRELEPQDDSDLDLVPQLLTNKADEFVWSVQLLAGMGYTEVNLNLGCPSRTVVGKGRGYGFLRHLDELEAFLDTVCDQSPLPVSVKTRVGMEIDEEYGRILELYCQYPLTELIVHPRVQKDFYKGTPRQELYGMTLKKASFPVAYNGDVFGADDLEVLRTSYPATRHVMLGRGIMTNPALARMIRGGAPLTAGELRAFHDRLFEAYESEVGGNAVARMKEWWGYAQYAFADSLAVHRVMRKARHVGDYRSAADKVFATQQLAADPRFRGA